MAMHVDNNVAVNWSSLVNALGGEMTTNGTGKAEGATSRTLTITAKVDGVDTPITINIPDDLELPEKVDQAAIDSLIDKLKTVDIGLSDEQIKTLHEDMTSALKSLQAELPSGSTTDRSTLFFDLYKLMALLIEVAQKQRDASREMRLAENMMIQNSILAQADQQKSAAWNGMIASAICCGMQFIAQGVSLGMQAKAFKAQLDTLTTSGVNSAQQNLNMLKIANDPEAAMKQLNSVSSQVGDIKTGHGTETIRQEVSNSFSESTAKLAKFHAAEQKATSTKEQLVAYQVLQGQPDIKEIHAGDIPDAGPLKEAFTKVDQYLDKAGSLGLTENEANLIVRGRMNFESLSFQEKAEYTNLNLTKAGVPQADLGTKTSTELRADASKALDTKVDTLKAQLTGNTKAVETARTELRDEIRSNLEVYEQDFEAAREKVAHPPENATKAELSQAKQDLQMASDKLKMARATAYEKMAQKGVTTNDERLADINSADTKLQVAAKFREGDVAYLQATRTIQRIDILNGMFNVAGNVAQGAIQNYTQMKMADVTKESGMQKRQEEELDQTKDLFSQAENLVNNVTQALQAIRQTESQSMRDTIQV